MLTWLGIVVFLVLPGLLVLEVLRCLYLEHRRDRIPIVLYHRLISRRAVESGQIPDNEPIYAAYDDTFDGQMRYLRESGHTTLSLDEYLDVRAGRRPFPPRPVIVTFDDGYESNYTMAFPALRRWGQKAVIFVAPEPDEHTRNLVAGIDGFLSPQQMRELDAGGVSIESHTLTHCILAELNDETARYELVESKRRLGDVLGRPVRHLAIPRAGYGRRIYRLALEAGYESICCNNKGSSTGWSDRFALPRIVIERDMSVEDFARALQPRHAALLRLVGNLKRIPERLFGPRGASRLRNWLYRGPLKALFVTRRLKRLVLAAAVVYVAAGLAFLWHLVAR